MNLLICLINFSSPFLFGTKYLIKPYFKNEIYIFLKYILLCCKVIYFLFFQLEWYDYICIKLCIKMCMCVYISLHMYIYVYFTYRYIYKYMYVYACICTYVYTYIFLYMSTLTGIF